MGPTSKKIDHVFRVLSIFIASMFLLYYSLKATCRFGSEKASAFPMARKGGKWSFTSGAYAQSYQCGNGGVDWGRRRQPFILGLSNDMRPVSVERRQAAAGSRSTWARIMRRNRRRRMPPRTTIPRPKRPPPTSSSSSRLHDHPLRRVLGSNGRRPGGAPAGHQQATQALAALAGRAPRPQLASRQRNAFAARRPAAVS